MDLFIKGSGFKFKLGTIPGRRQIYHDLVTMLGWLVPWPDASWNASLLHSWLASRYTAWTWNIVNVYNDKVNLISLCSPVLVPHIIGGVMPPEVTLKVSVRHCVAKDCPRAGAAASSSPFVVFIEETDEVWGPVITKSEKSKRSCKKETEEKCSAAMTILIRCLADVSCARTDENRALPCCRWSAVKVSAVLRRCSTTVQSDFKKDHTQTKIGIGSLCNFKEQLTRAAYPIATGTWSISHSIPRGALVPSVAGSVLGAALAVGIGKPGDQKNFMRLDIIDSICSFDDSSISNLINI